LYPPRPGTRGMVKEEVHAAAGVSNEPACDMSTGVVKGVACYLDMFQRASLQVRWKTCVPFPRHISQSSGVQVDSTPLPLGHAVLFRSTGTESSTPSPRQCIMSLERGTGLGCRARRRGRWPKPKQASLFSCPAPLSDCGTWSYHFSHVNPYVGRQKQARSGMFHLIRRAAAESGATTTTLRV
jgi:hypothetical protein